MSNAKMNLETVKNAIADACANRIMQQTEGKDGHAILTADKLAELKRALAYFQTDAFAKIAYADKINIGFIDGTNGAKWLGVYECTRLVGFMKMVAAGKSDVERPKDMQRFSVRLMNTCRAAIAKGNRITKADAHALVTRGQNKETEHGYAEGVISEGVHYATEYYADSYARRQGMLTLKAFESLGMVERIDEGNSRSISFQPVESRYFKRANAVYTANAIA